MAGFTSLGVGMLVGSLAGSIAGRRKAAAAQQGAAGTEAPVAPGSRGGIVGRLRSRIAEQKKLQEQQNAAAASSALAATNPPNAATEAANAAKVARGAADKQRRRAAGARNASTASPLQGAISAGYSPRSLIGG